MDDFRKVFYSVVLGFILVIVGWVSFVTFSGCGFSLNNCNASVPIVSRTSIPTLVPATLPIPTHPIAPTVSRLANLLPTQVVSPSPTLVSAVEPTTSASSANTAEVARPSNPGGPGAAVNLTGDPNSGQQIFVANCQTCHAAQGKGGIPNPGSSDGTVPALNPIDPTIANADPKVFAYNVDLFVEHGSTPDGANPTLSMPAWGDQKKLMPQQIADVIAYVISLNPVSVASNATVAGTTVTSTASSSSATTVPAETPASTTSSSSAVPRPSNPGGPGAAVNLTGDPNSGAQIFAANCVTCHNTEGKGGIPNPGSAAGSCPALNPINPALKSSDHMTFVTNLDLFIQHGSTPAGPGPTFSMPPWGDKNALTQQQIADVISYIISLNP